MNPARAPRAADLVITASQSQEAFPNQDEAERVDNPGDPRRFR